MFFPKCPCCGALVTIRKFRDSDGVEVWNNTRGIARTSGVSCRTLIKEAGGLYDYGGPDTMVSVGNAVTAGDEGCIVRWRDDGDRGAIERYSESITEGIYDAAQWGGGGPAENWEFALSHLDLYWTAGSVDGVQMVQAYDPDTLEGEWAVELPEVEAASIVRIAPAPDGILVQRVWNEIVPIANGCTSMERGRVDHVSSDGELGANRTWTFLNQYHGTGAGTGDIEFAAVDGVPAATIGRDGRIYFLWWGGPPGGSSTWRLYLVITGTDLVNATMVEIPGNPLGGGPLLSGNMGPSGYRAASMTLLADSSYVYASVSRHSEPHTLFPLGIGAAPSIRNMAYDSAGVQQWTFNGLRILASDDAGAVFTTMDGFTRNIPGFGQVEYTSLLKWVGGENAWYTDYMVRTIPERVITADGYHYFAGTSRDHFSIEDGTTRLEHMEACKVDAATGELIWTARHSSDDGEDLLDVVKIDDAVYVVGEGSTYRPEDEESEQ